MDRMQIIKSRKSVRTFNGEKITPEDKEKLLNYTKTIKNPYNIPVEFMLLDREKYNLSSPVIKGEDTYIAAKVSRVKHCEEAYGYSFEKLILYAWSLGIGTTWIGGTLNRPLFENAANTKDDEYMMIVTPIGYPSKTQSEVDAKLRESVHGNERLPSSKLFFDKDFNTPLDFSEDCLDAVRWAPSAANRQPWRIVKDNDDYHFYLEHTPGYPSGVGWDVQKIDLGIAICHLMFIKDGKFIIDEPEIETNEYTEYIATISCESD
ncbi:MAG: hypothetical protein IJ672_03450 [Methanobrevibacter sp.]|nr:hypothetical protein [Methanobrevibacter sp.]MBR1610533.1 hypothetical protein [Methanobrevibacter sp.]